MESRERREVLLWLAIFTLTAIFQFWRASPLDGFIFLLIIALIAITAINERSYTTYLSNAALTRKVKSFFGSALMVLAISRIHTIPSMIAMLALLPLLLISKEKEDFHQHPRKSVIKSSIAWSLIALAIASWELMSYILGEVTGKDFQTPTISMLVDPFLHHSGGRIFFVFIWGFVGYELLFLRRGK